MCLAIPMRVDAIDGFMARCSTRGVSRDISLFMLEEGSVAVGEQVLVHVGYAIQVISENEARTTWQAFDQVLSREAER